MKCDLALHADLLVSWAVGRASTAALTPTYGQAALSSSLLDQPSLSQLCGPSDHGNPAEDRVPATGDPPCGLTNAEAEALGDNEK